MKLGDKQLSLGETRYLLQFYFHFSCDALFSQCWFALPEVNFSKEYISKSLSKFPSFNYIITNAVEFDVLEVYEPEEIDTGNDTEKYYIIPYDLVANLRDEYQPSVLFLDEATVYHEILKNVDSTKTLVIKY